jgi:hypothetical protein
MKPGQLLRIKRIANRASETVLLWIEKSGVKSVNMLPKTVLIVISHEYSEILVTDGAVVGWVSEVYVEPA